MKCRICGGFSSAQTCWHCSTSPAALRVAELERENADLRSFNKTGAERLAHLKVENAKLRDGIDCATNALTDSINCSGNDAATNLHFVRKLRALIA